MNTKSQHVFLLGTRIFGVLGPCKLLIRKLNQQGYQVHVLGRIDDKYPVLYENNCTIHSLRVKRSYTSFASDILDILKLMRLLLRYKPSHLHTFNPKPQLLGFFAVLVSSNTRFYIGVTGLGNTFIRATYLKPVIEFIMKLSVRRANFVFFQNEIDLNLFRNHFCLPGFKAKLFKSPGVDLEKFKFSPLLPCNEELKPKLLRVLFVGRLIWQKGVDDFLNTFKKLELDNAINNFSFTLIGDIDTEHPDRLDSDTINYLEQSDIKWIRWTDVIERFYQDSDLLLFMSDREGGPRAILEASAIGRPTIGCDAPGVNQLIIPDVTGFLVQKGDISAIIKYLLYYHENRPKIEQHGRNARSMIAESLSLENATIAQLEMYNII